MYENNVAGADEIKRSILEESLILCKISPEVLESKKDKDLLNNFLKYPVAIKILALDPTKSNNQPCVRENMELLKKSVIWAIKMAVIKPISLVSIP